MVAKKRSSESDRLHTQNPHSYNADKNFRLYSFEMIPDYLRSNPYIRTGYRCGLTVKGCLIR